MHLTYNYFIMSFGHARRMIKLKISLPLNYFLCLKVQEEILLPMCA